jgi:diguanylate cyclase (GGDEF)-like protein/PAS domain S-box-containing protein
MKHANLGENFRIDYLNSRLSGSSSESAFIAETTASGHLKLIDANSTWLRLMGFDVGSQTTPLPEGLEDRPSVKAFLLQLQRFLRENDLSALSHGMRFAVDNRQMLTHVMPVCDTTGRILKVVGAIRDVTDSHVSGTSLKRLNCELQALSDCNQALMRAQDEQTLLVDICRIICEVAGYRMAWVGYPERDEPHCIRAVAWAGEENGYLTKAGTTWADESEPGCGPSGIAMRSGVTDTIQDFSTDPRAASWREQALSRGYHSPIALPLKDTLGKTFGMLNIYADQTEIFTLDECLLLERLAGDLAFGINVLRARLERKRAEAERQSNLHFFESMDKINRAIQGAADLEQMMIDVLDAVLEIFRCDRAYLMYPCDPDALTWKVPVERTRPAYPGVLALGLEMEMSPGVAEKLHLLLDQEGPVQLGPETANPIPAELVKPFELKSMMAMAIYPKIDLPWEFGIHQCASARSWNDKEERLFNEIGLRLADGLTGMLSFRTHQESEDKLSEAERHLHNLVNNLPDCIARFDREGRVLYVNQATERIFGFTAEEAIGTLLLDTGPGSAAENALLTKMVKQAFDEGVANSLEMQWSTVRGKRYFDVLHIPEKDEAGSVVSVLGIGHDITDRKLAEEALRSSEERYRRIVDTASEGIWMVDANGVTSFVNARMADMLGYEMGDMVGSRIDDFLFEEEKDTAEEWVAEIRRGNQKSDERRFRRRDGETLWALASASPIFDNEQAFIGMINLITDITERKQQQEQLLYQAHYDPLTGLPNRFLAMDRLEQNIRLAARSGTSTALLFLDLDDFKKVNDVLGHEVGDQVLKQAATRLKVAVRNSDTVARLGGDEFIVLIHDIPDGEAIRPVADKIVQTFQEVFRVMGREVMLTASLGISIYPNNGNDPLLLLRNADTAMYHAKAMGRNAYQYFTESMNLDVARRLQMEEQLRLALGRNELYLEYQPIIEVASGNIVGVEALLRWQNKILGEVPASKFIDVAEQTGMIIDIGDWVFESALSHLHGWGRERDFRLALNVSTRQFRQVGFVANLKQSLRKAGIRGEQLELEITEGILLGGEVGAAEVIAQLRELGVYISMDDFGTGYSSLSYLRNYHFDTLKVDRVFIRDIIDDPNGRELIIATLRMARGLGVRVVAEGVETAEQLAFLRRERCDCAQGLYLGPPMKEQEIAELLKREAHLGLSD